MTTAQQTKQPDVAQAMLNALLETKVKRAVELQQQIAPLTKELNAIKDELRATMSVGKVDVLHIAGYKLLYSEYISKIFDAEAFKKSHKRLFTKFQKDTPKTRFEIGLDQ